MNVVCLTGGWNCKKLLPYFLRHYETFCDKIVFLDFMSDDGTQEIAQSCPVVEFRQVGKPYVIDIFEGTKWANEAYKEFRGVADWVLLPTTDEFLYAKEGMRNVLQDYLDKGVTYPEVTGYNMFHDEPPDTDKQLWEVYKFGVPHTMFNKRIVFSPELTEMNYCHGLHWAGPTGNVVSSNEHEIKLLHYRYWGYADLVELHLKLWEASSQFNKDGGFGGYNPKGDGFHTIPWWEEEKAKRTEVI